MTLSPAGTVGKGGGVRFDGEDDISTISADRLGLELAGRKVLDGVTLQIHRHELLAIVGPNGAGKSSLIKLLAGVRSARQGGVSIDGKRLGDWDRRALARAVAYVPQERVVQWPLSVRSVVALGRLPHGAPGDELAGEDKAAVDAALAVMDLADLAARPATELSGGELVRVLIARALAQDTRFILADEPVAGLDPAHQFALFRRFRELADAGRGIAVALHDLSLAVRYCHRVAVLAQGRLVALGNPGEVLSRELIRRVYGIEAFCGEVEGMATIVPLAITDGSRAGVST